MKGYEIVRISKHNFDDFMFLYGVVKGVTPVSSYYLGKYNTTYTGAEHIGFIAYSKAGEPAATYGLVPTLFSYGTKVILTAQAVEAMTHPNHKMKGLFTELLHHTTSHAKKEGIEFLFAFPNPNSYHGFSKFGWITLYKMRRYYFPAKGRTSAKIIRKFFPGIYENKLLNAAGSEPGNFSHADLVSTDLNLASVLYNKDYFQYKCYGESTMLNFNNGYVWAKMKPYDFCIGNLFPFKPADLLLLINELRIFAASLGYDQIYFDVSPNAAINKLLQGFVYKETLPVIFYPISNKVFNKEILFAGSDYDTF